MEVVTAKILIATDIFFLHYSTNNVHERYQLKLNGSNS